MDIHSLLSSFSYLAIFVLMLSNGVTNLPSSQIVYLICGYFVSTGNLQFIPTIIFGALGNTIGNTIAFLLIKKYKLPLARKLLMVDEATFDKVHSALNSTFTKRGMWWLFFGKLIPSVKAFIPIIAGLANTKTKITLFIFLVASFIWATGITSLGYYFGENITLKSFTIVSLVIGSIIIFVVYKKIYKKLR
ncbi:DedA family protein [Candidatus Gracilibacteria bacterium]|nr:DedA family protein [Candidatus Gracilibacteria bacterium]MCF7898564.1 DedA family protein [Candidatus Paceibacterota bacterium]